MNITINPDQLWTAVDMARRAQIQTQTARQWLRRHWDELPPPALVIPLGGYQKFLHVWTRKDGDIIFAAYQKAIRINGGSPADTYIRPQSA